MEIPAELIIEYLKRQVAELSYQLAISQAHATALQQTQMADAVEQAVTAHDAVEATENA